MVDKISAKVQTSTKNWWNAVKFGYNIRGYNYYKAPPEIKYRYPAPGSIKPHKSFARRLYKEDWKTSWRNSPHNIRPKFNQWDDEEGSGAEYNRSGDLEHVDFENVEH